MFLTGHTHSFRKSSGSFLFLFLFLDGTGRYSYENQPEICKWNLLKLAEDLSSFAGPLETFIEILNGFQEIYENHYYSKLRAKVTQNVLKKSNI